MGYCVKLSGEDLSHMKLYHLV